MLTMACVEIEFRTIFDCMPVCLVLLLQPISDCCRFFRFLISFVCVFMCAYACYWFFCVICLFALCAELLLSLLYFLFGCRQHNCAITYRRYCHNRHDQILMNVDLVVIVAAVNAIVLGSKSPFNIFSHLIIPKMLSFA